MSADNGIYILKTLAKDKAFGDYEYRVAHLQAVENMNFDWNASDPVILASRENRSTNPDVHIANARRMWANCSVHTNIKDALMQAYEMEQKILADEYCPVLEYGISSIHIDRVF